MKPVCYDSEKIYINGKLQKIMSGAMHHFRVVPQYWHDRLLKLKDIISYLKEYSKTPKPLRFSGFYFCHNF